MLGWQTRSFAAKRSRRLLESTESVSFLGVLEATAVPNGGGVANSLVIWLAHKRFLTDDRPTRNLTPLLLPAPRWRTTFVCSNSSFGRRMSSMFSTSTTFIFHLQSGSLSPLSLPFMAIFLFLIWCHCTRNSER